MHMQGLLLTAVFFGTGDGDARNDVRWGRSVKPQLRARGRVALAVKRPLQMAHAESQNATSNKNGLLHPGSNSVSIHIPLDLTLLMRPGKASWSQMTAGALSVGLGSGKKKSHGSWWRGLFLDTSSPPTCPPRAQQHAKIVAGAKWKCSADAVAWVEEGEAPETVVPKEQQHVAEEVRQRWCGAYIDYCCDVLFGHLQNLRGICNSSLFSIRGSESRPQQIFTHVWARRTPRGVVSVMRSSSFLPSTDFGILTRLTCSCVNGIPSGSRVVELRFDTELRPVMKMVQTSASYCM
jgi:hypothetical protein